MNGHRSNPVENAMLKRIQRIRYCGEESEIKRLKGLGLSKKEAIWYLRRKASKQF